MVVIMTPILDIGSACQAGAYFANGTQLQSITYEVCNALFSNKRPNSSKIRREAAFGSVICVFSNPCVERIPSRLG